MSDGQEREPFVGLPVESTPPLWRRIAGWLWEDLRHRLGYPARLVNAINTGRLKPVPLQRETDTFWLRSVVYWNEWMSATWHGRPWTLDYRKPGYDRRLECHHIPLPEVEKLIQEEVINDFSCDITDVRGISASRSCGHDITDIDDFRYSDALHWQNLSLKNTFRKIWTGADSG